MWTSTNFKIYLKKYTYFADLKGWETETDLKSVLEIDDILFMNMVEISARGIDKYQEFQSLICEDDGVYACEFGSWIAIRHIEDLVLFIPCLVKMFTCKSKIEYEPPKYLVNKGVFWLYKKDFLYLMKQLHGFEEFNSTYQMDIKELIWLYKWEAPVGLFGVYPVLKNLNKEVIVSVSYLNTEDIIQIINEKLSELKNSNNFKLEPISQNDELISLNLKGNLKQIWNPLCKNGEQIFLLFGETFKIITT